jgi:hypothetical protein
MSPLCQCFTLAEWLRQMEIIDSMQLVLRRILARVGGTPRRRTVNVSLGPSRTLPAAAGVGVFQFPCQRFELGFGDDRGRRVVGGPHLLGHRLGEVIGQLVRRRFSACASGSVGSLGGRTPR